MQGWILNRFAQHNLRADSHGVHRFLAEAQARGISVSVVAPNQLDIIIEAKGEHRFLLDGKTIARPDFLLNRMGSATTYYALAVMRQIENAGVYVPNRSHSVALVRDKMQTMQVLAKHGLPVAKSMLAKYPVDIDLVEREFGFPVIVKTLAGSQGRGVFLCETRQKFDDLIAMITTSQGNPNFVIQKFIAQSRGRDLRVFVIGGRIVGCMARLASPGSFKANYSNGGTVESFPVTPLIEKLALEAVHVLGLEIAGIDLLFDHNGYIICEANSSPGFRGMEECSGLNIPGEIYHYIESRIKREKFAAMLPSGH